VDKKESDRRADKVIDEAEKDNARGFVYIFELSRKYDIDGYPKYNTARYINHSCDPNCEIHIIQGRIWIVAMRGIKKGEELTYDYGYEFEDFEDHECKCGAENCVGYIVAEEFRAKVRKALKRNRASASTA